MLILKGGLIGQEQVRSRVSRPSKPKSFLLLHDCQNWELSAEGLNLPFADAAGAWAVWTQNVQCARILPIDDVQVILRRNICPEMPSSRSVEQTFWLR